MKASGNPKDEIIDISDVIFPMIKPKIKKAVFLKVLENCIILTLSMIPKFFLPQVKRKPEKRNNMILILCPFIAGGLTILRYMINQHAAKFVCQAGSMTG